ncbi:MULTISPECIES: hypothetical protein [Pseudoalteromonas]|uniref:hypothetical protein n=1 Tax=Pseudoalteromonas TaxID=53246 RepID=UPI00160040C0|nr:hypothetical protein [Pseudoalteromonas sp. SR41-1]MBB1280439.1 hypothetical protein [Pseudoalteromonas sp. SR41-1]
MTADRYKFSNSSELIKLFNDSESSYESFGGDYSQSQYGTLANLRDMPEYELSFFPFTEIARKCGMKSFSLKRSSKTGRIYVWNVNLGGHAPKLELRPITLEHLMDVDLMIKYHENWAYELGCNISIDSNYEI